MSRLDFAVMSWVLVFFQLTPLWGTEHVLGNPDCSSVMGEVAQGSETRVRPKHRTNEFAYLYFPWASGWSKVHGELQVDDQVYVGLGGWVPSKVPKGVRGTNVYGRMHGGFVRFVLDSTPEQRANANRMLAEDMNQWALQTCASGAMHVVNRNTHIHLPLPFRISPFLSASYLYLKYRFGTGVKSIEVVGEIKPQQYALGIAGELAIVGSVGSASFGLWSLGAYILQLVPHLGLW